jgi:hypothetical protein
VPIIVVGIVLEAVLAVAFVNTRRRVVLSAMLGVAILVAAGVGLERLVVTDTEQIEANLDGAASALEADDLQRFKQHLSPSATKTQSRAEYALGIVQVTAFRISRLKITIYPLTSPPTAKARFRGAVHYQERTGMISYGIYRADFVVTLRREADAWRITDHIEHHDLR